MKAYRGVKVQLPCLTSAVDGDEVFVCSHFILVFYSNPMQ